MDTILWGGCCGSDGVNAFARPVLFCTAAEWVLSAAGGTAHDLRGADAAALQAQAFASENVFLIGAPVPELTKQDYQRLLDTHTAMENDATRLCTAQGARVLHVAVCRAQALQSALLCGKSDFESLVRAGRYGEFCVPDVIEIHNGMDAYLVQKRLMERINLQHIARGVQIFAPDTTYIAPDAEIGAGAQILPGTMIQTGCKIGAGCKIGPNTILEQAVIGDGTTVNSSQVYASSIGAQATVGPFAYVRPGCQVGDHTRIGDFVELKKAQIGDGTKVSHLTYIGDAEVGERVNFGCGTVVVNYDGYEKNKTVIGDDCFIGCNTNLVSPVTLGDRVFTAAGATITADVPDGALAVARARQKNLEGWNDKRRAAHGQSHGPAAGK